MPKSDKILDIAHISFLDLIKLAIAQSGAAAAKGALLRSALSTADKFETKDFPTFDDFVKSIELVQNAITSIEGKAVYLGDGLFGLPDCPFAESICNYKEVFDGLPEGYQELTEEFNKPGNITDKYHVGNGAGVSPFCSVHQPLRSGLSEKITISGKAIIIYQLGCKSGSGIKGFADKYIKETGYTQEKVNSVLNNHMCCYAVKVNE